MLCENGTIDQYINQSAQVDMVPNFPLCSNFSCQRVIVSHLSTNWGMHEAPFCHSSYHLFHLGLSIS